MARQASHKELLTHCIDREHCNALVLHHRLASTQGYPRVSGTLDETAQPAAAREQRIQAKNCRANRKLKHAAAHNTTSVRPASSIYFGCSLLLVTHTHVRLASLSGILSHHHHSTTARKQQINGHVPEHRHGCFCCCSHDTNALPHPFLPQHATHPSKVQATRCWHTT